MKVVAKTFQGLEEVLNQELIDLGMKNTQIVKRAVVFNTDNEGLYRANYLLRSALRLLVSMQEFNVSNEDQLYNSIQSINWSKYLNINRTFAIDTVTNSSVFRHSKYVAFKTKDAIVDQFRKKTGRRPSIDVDDPDLRINVMINETNMKISLDSSGGSLHKRNYRIKTGDAPINEVLAAGLILLSDWDKEQPFYDPMCGSGTLPIEAFMMGQNRPAQYFRKDFGFTKWRHFDFELWDKIRKEENDKMLDKKPTIICSDKDRYAISATEKNFARFRPGRTVWIRQKDFFDAKMQEEPCHVLMNPPYDNRLEIEDDIEFYKEIGDTLKQSFKGSSAWIFSGNVEAIKHVGLKTSRKLHLFNGPIPCKFHKFDMH